MNVNSPDLSIVIPCLNEQDVIGETLSRVSEVAVGSFPLRTIEIIVVDDGSVDATVALVRRFKPPENVVVRVLSFTRNFGHQVAVSAGIQHSQGKAVAVLDADLQDPPELLPEMVMKIEEGYDVVTGKRISREGRNWTKKFGYFIFYRLLRLIVLDIDIPLDTGDFRVISRRAANALNELPERSRFVRGLIPYFGFPHCEVAYNRKERAHGKSKYTTRKLVELAFDGLFSFSTRPLRLAFYLGGWAFSLSLLGVVVVFLIRLGTDQWVPGWAGMMILILSFSGVQFLVLGLLGEYLAKIFVEVKSRPQFVLREESQVSL